MKRKPVKQHPDLFEESIAPIQVPPDLQKEMLHGGDAADRDHDDDGDREQGDR
jgi:hypothetical protein